MNEGGDERWIGEVVPAVLSINAHWSGLRRKPGGGLGLRPAVREQQKVGRNDPCPCGSGKKYKKCCGAAAL